MASVIPLNLQIKIIHWKFFSSNCSKPYKFCSTLTSFWIGFHPAEQKLIVDSNQCGEKTNNEFIRNLRHFYYIEGKLNVYTIHFIHTTVSCLFKPARGPFIYYVSKIWTYTYLPTFFSINTVLIVSKTGNFHQPTTHPVQSFADVIYGWSQGYTVCLAKNSLDN